MANYASKTTLNAAIDAVITGNGNNEITGPILATKMKEMINFCLPHNLVQGDYAYLRVTGWDGTNDQEGDLRRGLDDDGNEVIEIYEDSAWRLLGGGE